MKNLRVISLLGLILIGIGIQELCAQAWTAVNDALATHKTYMAKAHQGKLWLLDDGNAFSNGKAEALRLKVWDNANWKAYPEYTLGGVDSIHGGAFVGLDSSVYVICYPWSNGIRSISLLRFDIPGQNWTEINSFAVKVQDGSEVNAITIFDDNIYLAGNLLNGQGENQIIRVLPAFSFAEVVGLCDGQIDYMGEYQGTLYVGGAFTQIGGNAIPNLALFSNDIFSAYSGTAGITEFLKTLVNGEMVFVDAQNSTEKYLNFFSLQGDQTLNLDFPKDFIIRNFAIDGGDYYSIQTSSADLYPAAIYHKSKHGNTWNSMKSKLDVMNSVLVNTGTQVYLVELGENTYHIEQNALGFVKAQVFVDMDDDCLYSSGDILLEKDLIIQDVNRDAHWHVDPQNGQMNAFVSAGNYSFTLPNLPKTLSASKCGLNKNVQINHLDSVHLQMPLSIIDKGDALKIQITSAIGFRARQGFEEEYYLDVYNESSEQNTCDIWLTLPEAIQFTRASTMPFDSTDAIYKWHINLAPYKKTRIVFHGTVAVNTPSYTRVRIDAWSDQKCYSEDNRDTLNLEVRGAFDPNDKQNSPAGFITKKVDEIIYHIRFQNTGSDTAYRVRVIDTLDINLNMVYIQLLNVSHPFKLDLDGTKQTFTFDNIMLPDSTTDLAGSQGFITYKVKLRPNLANGDSIQNRAYIYFDYQKPIETNTVTNAMKEEENDLPPPIVGLDQRYLVYPNPTKGSFRVVNFTETAVDAVLYDAQGKVLGVYQLSPDEETNIQIEGLSQGIYFLRFPSWNTQESIVLTN